MSHVVSFVLSLAGSLLATLSLAARRAPRPAGPPARWLPARLVLALFFLGSAAVGRVVEMLEGQGVAPPASWLDLVLLLAGAGATLWAFTGRGPSPARESPSQRVGGRGKVALGLLLADLGVDLSSGRLSEAVQPLLGGAAGTAILVGLPGLVLVALGTGVAAAAIRGQSTAPPGPGPLWRRLGTRARVAFAILGLALAAVAAGAVLAPSSGLLVCLMLLALGIAAGLAAVFHQGKEPALAGISPRGWVSLALLAAAGLTLTAQEVRHLGGAVGRRAGPSARARGEETTPRVSVVDNLSVWSLRSAPPDSAEPVDPERGRLQKELAAMRRKLSTLEEQLRARESGSAPGPAPPASQPVVDTTPARRAPSAPQASSVGDARSATAAMPSSVDMEHFRSQKP
jgi:hypothetical protein